MRILAISGSLRAASHNSALLRAMARLAPLGDLPLFNPDLEPDDFLAVTQLRTQIMHADALLIASPEYAHGVTGVMKNALDWMVGCEALVHKPVVLLNAAPRAVHAQAVLHEIISVMSAHIITAASITVPILGAKLTEDDMVAHPHIAALLSTALSALSEGVLLHQARASVN